MQKTGPIEIEHSSFLRQLLTEAGASLVGFAGLSCLNLKTTDEFPFGICFCLRYEDSAVNDLPNDNNWLRMRARLQDRAKDIYSGAREYIRSQGYRYGTITSNIPSDELSGLREELPQKTLATLSSLGWIGRSTLLVTPEYGPRVRIGTLITNMPLSVDRPIVESSCGDCTACVDMCPVKATRGDLWPSGIMRSRLLDAKGCHEYLWSTKPTLGRRQTCALCLKVCPVGQNHRDDG